MPAVKLGKRRSGEHARGGARINQLDDVPNTATPAWSEKFQGRSSTADVMGDVEEESENDSPQKQTYAQTAATMKRPMSERSGVGRGRGKHPRTMLRRVLNAASVLEKEVRMQTEFKRLDEILVTAIARSQTIIVPEAVRLHYNEIHLYIKYQAVRLYCWYRAEGWPAFAASELAGHPSLTSSSTVRDWANDFRCPFVRSEEKVPKDVGTFSPYARGGHIKWFLENEVLRRKAFKWICKSAEAKGTANMTIQSFHKFLVGTYDAASKTFTERGLLTDVLESKSKTGLSLETCRVYLHKLGFSYDFTRKNVYADGFDRPDVVKHRNEFFLPAMADAERRSYMWVPPAWLEEPSNWPKDEGHHAWVEQGKPEVHVDTFEWKNDKTPLGIDRFAAWGPMGGVLSSRLLPDEKPVIIILQDETCIRQYDTQKKAWRHNGAAMSIAPKGEGAAIMYSGYICEQEGGFPMLTEPMVIELNKKMTTKMKAEKKSAAAIKAALHDIKALRAEGLITDLDADGLPVISEEKVAASKLYEMPGLIQLEIGKNKEGFWDGDCQVEQAKKIQKIMIIKYPGHVIHHVYDWSSGHHAYDDDALNGNKMNAGPGGKQPSMHDTTVFVTECGGSPRNLTAVAGSSPPCLAQTMSFRVGDVVLIEKMERVLAEGDPLVGKPKGAMQVARERDVYKKGMSMKGPVLKDAPAGEDDDEPLLEGDDFDDDAGDNDEEKGVRRDVSLSVIHVLSQMSDFKNEKCKLQKVVESMGGECSWLSKFHACCNGIEYVWGNRKKAHRKVRHNGRISPHLACMHDPHLTGT